MSLHFQTRDKSTCSSTSHIGANWTGASYIRSTWFAIIELVIESAFQLEHPSHSLRITSFAEHSELCVLIKHIWGLIVRESADFSSFIPPETHIVIFINNWLSAQHQVAVNAIHFEDHHQTHNPLATSTVLLHDPT